MKYFDESKQFDIDGTAVIIEPYGEGHINETYFMQTDRGTKYILQKINSKLFADVRALMNNIVLVTSHIKKGLNGDDLSRRVLTVVKTKDDEYFYKNAAGEYFRVYIFIDKAKSYQLVEKPSHFYESAYAFGTFQNQLADFDASLLFETIPQFHDTERRFNDFEKALKADILSRGATVNAEVDFILSRKEYCTRITSLLKSKEMALKVTHNDTKLNNVMIDLSTDKALAVIDLDTVMPGCSCYDFGDSIRFGCNPAAEDEKNLSLVNFSKDLFDVYTEGYLSALKGNITKIEKDNLAFSAILMTFECGMRFLEDYLKGDTYFRTRRENQNLDRARTQFKLVSDMERVMGEMERTVKSFS